MIARLGLSIHSRELRAVLVRRGRIRWRASLECSYADAGPDALCALLESLPKRVGPCRATIAIGLAWCQVKRIEGVPAAKDSAMLTRLVRENADSFFLRRGSRSAISDVVTRPNAAVWAAAFDQDMVTTAIAALRKRGLASVRVVPSVSAIASVIPAGVHVCEDGDTAVELTVSANRTFERVRRITSEEPAPPAMLDGLLATLADDGWPTAAALGAALAPRRALFEWHPSPDPKRSARMRRFRIGLAGTMAGFTGVGAIAAPGMRAARITREASLELATLRTSQVEVARAQSDLRRAAITIERVERFREQRGRTTVLLGALSQALPESTAMVSFRLDTLEGSFVALTPHAADIVPQLVSVTDIVEPRIVGSLTKEIVNGAQLERATVRFRRLRPASPPGRTGPWRPPAPSKPAAGGRG